MATKTFYKKQIATAAQEAIDNWDWEQEEPAKSKKMVAALKHLCDHPQEQTVSNAFKDIWDWLDEYARNTAADM